MNVPAPKTLDEHIDYCLQMARLKLWFAWTHARNYADEAFADVLRLRTNLWGLTPHCARIGAATAEDYALPEWRAMMDPLEALAAETARTGDVAAFEEGGLVIFRDAVCAAARASYPTCVPAPNGEMGCLRYDPPSAEMPDRVHYHIGNCLQPRSIFDDPCYLPRCLRALVADARERHGVEILKTGTWLNSHPAFVQYFPAEYRRNMGPEQTAIKWGGGFWGQFMNARGCFNAKYAERFRATGRMPYWRRESWCTFDALLDHLRQWGDVSAPQ